MSFRSISQSEDPSQICHHEPARADGTVSKDDPHKQSPIGCGLCTATGTATATVTATAATTTVATAISTVTATAAANTATPTVTVTTAATVTAAATATTATAATVNATTAPTIATLIATVTAAATTATTVTATAVAITDKANQAWIKSYLHVVKRAATVALQAEMGEGERDLLPSWQLDHIDTLAVVGIIIGPVGGDDYAVSVGEGTTTSRVAYNKTHSTPRT